jgi:transposase
MLSKEDFVTIQALVRRGVYLRDIAWKLRVHPKTVTRALKRGSAPRRAPRKRGSVLDPYRDTVDRLLAEGVWNAVVILREIQEKGYRGGISILRDYIRPKRVLRQGRATVRFETPPGKQLQNDWGQIQTVIGGRPTQVHFIVNTLGWSRRFHFWCTDCEDAEHTYEGLILSFEYLGGVTEEVLVDNQKAAVLENRPGKKPRFNERFLDLAGHYGFTPRACQPGRARTKGKDERMVGYIKGNFFVRYRAFDSWAHLNQQAEQWLREEADRRVHGTVREVVSERFTRELPSLKPLPSRRYDTSYLEVRQVSWDGYVEVRGNRYSVPDSLVGRTVTVRVSLEGELRVYDGEAVAASHRLRPAEEGWVTVPSHHAALWRKTLQVTRRPLAVYEEVSRWN